MTVLPKDPVILLSYINTQLRDFYPSLDELCISLNADKQTLCNTLAQIDYYYDEDIQSVCLKLIFCTERQVFYGRFILWHYFFVLLLGGESHGPSIGVVVEAVRQGFFLSEEDIQMQLNRRRPGQSRYSTPTK